MCAVVGARLHALSSDQLIVRRDRSKNSFFFLHQHLELPRHLTVFLEQLLLQNLLDCYGQMATIEAQSAPSTWGQKIKSLKLHKRDRIIFIFVVLAMVATVITATLLITRQESSNTALTTSRREL